MFAPCPPAPRTTRRVRTEMEAAAARLSPEKRKKKKKPTAGAATSPSVSPELRRSNELRPSARALAAPPIAAAAALPHCSSQPDRSPTGLAFSSAPSRDAFNVQLRAERAEALVVQLRAQLHHRTVEAFMFGQEVNLADDLTAVCESTHQEQHAALHELAVELTALRATCSEQRESVMQSSRRIADLEIAVKSGEEALAAERAALATAKAKYHEQGGVWRSGAERIRADRQTDAAKKLERFRLWEDTISQWLEDGRNKKLEDIVYSQVRACTWARVWVRFAAGAGAGGWGWGCGCGCGSGSGAGASV